MKKASYTKYMLRFKQPGRTSRGTLTEKETWFIKIWDTEAPHCFGIGECALFRGLSAEDCPGYEQKLKETCLSIHEIEIDTLNKWSSIRFGVETALQELQSRERGELLSTPFTRGEKTIEINGLIWMDNQANMLEQIKRKLAAGYRCIKLKIGGIDFESELELLRYIRERYSKEQVEIRVDANGAFTPEEAMRKLERLAALDLHSIEQPIRPGQFREMENLCRCSPLPIALDEELIYHFDERDKIDLVKQLQPHYLVIKPALHGGFKGLQEWIAAAAYTDTRWWVTSALESNVGLNAIAGQVAEMHPQMPQGLGTGELYTNNIPSPLRLQGSLLGYDPQGSFDYNIIPF